MIFVSERIDVTAWEELIAQSSTANFFQTKECYDSVSYTHLTLPTKLEV